MSNVFNQSTVSGAIDIIAVQHDDGTIYTTPFHVHFGKTKVKFL
jgi:phosphatidate phosphatase LPIN